MPLPGPLRRPDRGLYRNPIPISPAFCRRGAPRTAAFLLPDFALLPARAPRSPGIRIDLRPVSWYNYGTYTKQAHSAPEQDGETVANIDIAAFIDQCGIRKARFGGLEPDDVRQALLALSSEYEKRLTRAEERAQQLAQENAGLEKHCQALTARNRMLTDQNVSLAGSSDNYSRQRQELSGQVSTLREKNRSLSDQNAVLTLKNADLTRENRRLQEQADQAQAALKVKGRELDEAKQSLEASRQKLMSDTQAKADEILRQAREEARKTAQQAESDAAAIARTARDQARVQAQELIDAAASEANEIQNIHQLRLNNLKAEIAQMDQRRTELLDYLKHMADVLTRAGQEAVDTAPGAAADTEPPAEELDLHPVEAPEVQLDFSEKAIAKAAAELAAEEPPEPEPQLTEPRHAEPAGEPLPEPETERTRPGFTLVEDDEEEDAPAHEVPGAIFSQPILRQEQEPVLDEQPPSRGPRRPVMPVLTDDDEEEDDDLLPEEDEEESPTADTSRPVSRRRLQALRALRALRRRSQGKA